MDMQFNSEMLNVCTDAVPTPPSPEPPRHRIPPPVENSEPPVRPMRRKHKINITDTNTPRVHPPRNITAISSGNVINIIKSQGIHFGPEITYNIETTNNRSKSEPKINKTPDIISLLESKFQITHEYMDTISKQLGEGWRNIFRNMGFKDGEIELIYESNYPKGISEVIYQMLLDWTRSDKRTLGELCTVLWNEEKYNLIEKLSIMYNESTEEKS